LSNCKDIIFGLISKEIAHSRGDDFIEDIEFHFANNKKKISAFL